MHLEACVGGRGLWWITLAHGGGVAQSAAAEWVRTRPQPAPEVVESELEVGDARQAALQGGQPLLQAGHGQDGLLDALVERQDGQQPPSPRRSLRTGLQEGGGRDRMQDSTQ